MKEMAMARGAKTLVETCAITQQQRQDLQQKRN